MSITQSKNMFKAAIEAYREVVFFGKSVHGIIYDDIVESLKRDVEEMTGIPKQRPATRLREHYSMEREGWKCYAFYPKKGSIESFGHNMHKAVLRCNCSYVEAEKRFAVWLVTQRLVDKP